MAGGRFTTRSGACRRARLSRCTIDRCTYRPGQVGVEVSERMKRGMYRMDVGQIGDAEITFTVAYTAACPSVRLHLRRVSIIDCEEFSSRKEARTIASR